MISPPGQARKREPYRESTVFEKNGLEIADEASCFEEVAKKLALSEFDAIYTCNGLSREEISRIEKGLEIQFPMLKMPAINGEETLVELLKALKYELILNKKKSKGKTSQDANRKRAVLRSLLKNEFVNCEELSLAAREIELGQENESCILVLKFAPQYKDIINFDRYDDDLVDRAVRSAQEEQYPGDAGNISYVSITMNNGFIVLARCGQSDYLIDALASVGDAMGAVPYWNRQPI